MALPNRDTDQENSATKNSGLPAAVTENKRQFVRVYYPQDCPDTYLPELTIHYRAYRLLDISETGIRFLVPRMNLLQDDILTGRIKFIDDSIIDFSGVVVRRIKDQIALKLIIGIPYSYVASEQVRLRTLVSEGKLAIVKK